MKKYTYTHAWKIEIEGYTGKEVFQTLEKAIEYIQCMSYYGIKEEKIHLYKLQWKEEEWKKKIEKRK